MAALATVTTGLLAALAVPASAIEIPLPGRGSGMTLCNERAQSITGEFPRRGGWSTTLIRPGTCWSNPIAGGQADEQVVVYAHYDGGHKLAVDHFFYDSRTWHTRVVR
ncbi:hypothetical protein CUT44_10755 [Streptomyces carminius]|uniref:Uncharacterized protein n=2 Tax=Streptomyces carminius TaxID=2665496 RepID=A0A2M8M089_9ACTN|nr:hypothetical protein CUT44_10755 [Streptomyces carminius]